MKTRKPIHEWAVRWGISGLTGAGLFLLLVVVLPLIATLDRPVGLMAGGPTPVAAPARADQPKEAVFWPRNYALTASGRSNCIDLAGYGVLDLQYVIKEPSVNTTTLKLQYTNDNANFVDGATLVAAVTDTNELTQVFTFGRYTCLYATVSNTQPVTVEFASGIAK